MSDDTINILSKIKIFRGLIHKELREFDMYCKQASFKKNDTILREGEIGGEALYFVSRGELEIIHPKEIENMHKERFSKVKLATIVEGDCLGEYSFFDKKPISVSVVATKSGEILKILASDFRHVLNSNERIARIVYYNIIQSLLERIRKSLCEYDVYLM
jgi:CRP-like cAMP-binding protein